MDNIWSDSDISMTSASSSSLSLPRPPPPPPLPAFLTTHQNLLISTYRSLNDRVNNLMNTVVDLDISVRRERDEPSLHYLVKELEKAQEELVRCRDAKRRKEREIKEEEKRLRLIVGDESIMAKRQLNEILTHTDFINVPLFVKRKVVVKLDERDGTV